MDAVRYLEEARRMCRLFLNVACAGCPALINRQYCMFSDVIVNYGTKTTDAVKIVEEWSDAHPRKTRQSVFLEQWPEAEIDKSGCLMLCPMTVSAERRNRHEECTTLVCSDCRRKFWMHEVE